jgi:hypothetical protein
MSAALTRYCLVLAVACGNHDTPVATYRVSQGGGTSTDPAGAGRGGEAGDLISGAGAPNAPACSKSYPITAPGLTSRYKEGVARQTWFQAELDCESEGGHLIVVNEDAENTWMASVAAKALTNDVSTHQLSWIGLGDHATEGQFRWLTGADQSLARWAANEPNSLYFNEDCVEIRASGEWNDDHCDAELTYVCECDGAPVTEEWCYTTTLDTCGDCSTTCLSTQTCSEQQCTDP